MLQSLVSFLHPILLLELDDVSIGNIECQLLTLKLVQDSLDHVLLVKQIVMLSLEFLLKFIFSHGWVLLVQFLLISLKQIVLHYVILLC